MRDINEEIDTHTHKYIQHIGISGTDCSALMYVIWQPKESLLRMHE